MSFLEFIGVMFLALLAFSLLGLLFGWYNDKEFKEKMEKETLDKYRETDEYRKEIKREAEKLFLKMKEDFLKEEAEKRERLEEENLEKSKPFVNEQKAEPRESVEIPKYDFSNVKFYDDTSYLSKEELVEIYETKDKKKIDRKYLFPKKDVEDTSSEFYKKKVVISGLFEHFETRNEIAKILYDLGADIDTSLTERTSFLIKGENCGWSKEEKAIKYGCVIYSESEFLDRIKK